MAAGEDASLESTPSWAVATVCSGLILVALLIEHVLHLITIFVRRRKRKALNHAVDRLKAELRNLGFMSLLLTVAEQPITRFCVPTSWARTYLPCKNASLESSSVIEELDSCPEGKVSLVPAEGTQQLQMLILMFAIFHVLSCLLTICLGEAKMKRWESWEKETRTLDYQLSHDPRRFKLIKQTSFGKRHLKFWNNLQLLLWIVCFLRQFAYSISKTDYFALRHGFIKVHLAKDANFDFHKFLRRTLDQDFVMVVEISCWIWLYATLYIFFNAHEFYNHYWLPFIPLVMLLAIGTKLEFIINRMCQKSSEQLQIVQGIICVEPENNLFWFGHPKLLLHIIQFILIQNSFQLAFFTWTWYQFGFRSCFHRELEDISLSIGINLLVQFLCAYVILPLYALVTQMGSTMKETIFTERIVEGLKSWHNTAKRNMSSRTSVQSSSSTQPLAHPRKEIPQINEQASRASQFPYPSGRLELLEVQNVVEEIMECNDNNIIKDSELSFRLWWKKEVISQHSARK